MVINSFIKKNNTIIKNSTDNTAKNPVVELFYNGDGVNYSRYIFSVDYHHMFTTLLQTHFSLLNVNDLTHSLKMYNTSFFDYRLHNEKFLGKNRASSFDLILYALNDEFDEGNGFDQNDKGISYGKKIVSNFPSNGIERKTGLPWTKDFAIDTTEIKSIEMNDYGLVRIESNTGQTLIDSEIFNSIIGIQHFDTGKENLNIDVSNYINSVLAEMYDAYMNEDDDLYNFLANNNNFCLAFSPTNEKSKGENGYVGFFSKYSNSAYSPFIQSYMNDTISDDRTNFKNNRTNRLYYFNYVEDKLTNLLISPNVYIVRDPDDDKMDEYNLIELIDQADVKNPMNGVYYVDISIDIDTSECDIFYDLWEITQRKKPITKIFEQSFNVIENKSGFRKSYSSNNNITLFSKGIDRDERITRGEMREIFVLPRIKYTGNQFDENVEIYYRVYSKEGINEIPMIDFYKLHRFQNGEQMFYFDTNSFLPNTYYIDLKIINGDKVTIEKEFFKLNLIASRHFKKINNGSNLKPKIKNGSNIVTDDGEYVIDITGGTNQDIIDLTNVNFPQNDPGIETPNTSQNNDGEYIIDLSKKFNKK